MRRPRGRKARLGWGKSGGKAFHISNLVFSLEYELSFLLTEWVSIHLTEYKLRLPLTEWGSQNGASHNGAHRMGLHRMGLHRLG